jgi:hypothetical protein
MYNKELVEQTANAYASNQMDAEQVADLASEELLFNLLVDVARAYTAEVEVNSGDSHEEAESTMFVGLKENLVEIANGN